MTAVVATEFPGKSKNLTGDAPVLHRSSSVNTKQTSTPAPVVTFRLGGQLGEDARAAATGQVGGLSGLIREGLALRLYGNRNFNRARRARRAA